MGKVEGRARRSKGRRDGLVAVNRHLAGCRCPRADPAGPAGEGGAGVGRGGEGDTGPACKRRAAGKPAIDPARQRGHRAATVAGLAYGKRKCRSGYRSR